MNPKQLSEVEIVFPTNVTDLMPGHDEIPRDFFFGKNPYNEFISTWFYLGFNKNKQGIRPREGIDHQAAFGHIAAILRSFEPGHNYKIAAAAYLMSQWFELED